MHEMTLAEELLLIVQDTAQNKGYRRVRVLRLEIGKLSSIEPASLRSCFEAVARDSIADGARLEIIETAGAAWCYECAERVALASMGAACPRCGNYRMRVTEGAEMRVKELQAE